MVMAVWPKLWMVIGVGLSAHAEQPFWGCGLLGDLSSGIHKDGSTTQAMQAFIDGLKVSNKYNGKVPYWNWNYAPQDNDAGSHQYLTEDFVFMPEVWGVGAAVDKYVRIANKSGYIDSQGIVSPSQMADIFLGGNEPDIRGSCMGDMFGSCTASCTNAEVAANNCPEAHLKGPQGSAHANAAGHCNCWQDSHATGAGFWPVQGVPDLQPLPTCWSNPPCVSAVMTAWKQTGATVASKGYKYLTAPLVAVSMDWMDSFVEKACTGCSDISCGCPTHVGWHFYANDCQPDAQGGYAKFQMKLNRTVALMEKFPHLQGAVVNEVGMLNCAMDTPDAICVPNSPKQKYPASSQPNHACPSTSELPEGLGSFIEKLLQMAGQAKTRDGRRAVVSFSWFNEDMTGGTYNLRLFNDDGTLNQAGQSYVKACASWADVKPTTIVV